jgi:ComF family protein
MWIDSFLNLIFPPQCEVCHRKSEETLCHDCFAQVKFMKPQMGINSAAAYEGVVKTALHRFKFQNRKRLAQPLGIMLVNYLCQLPGFKIEAIDCIVPVPLHQRRQRARGFNQVELLAEVVGRYFEKPVVPAIARIRDTHPQFDLPREQRISNVKGVFKATNPSALAGRTVLLLDDIYTTGSTVAECSQAIRRAGAKKIEVLTLARAVEI